MTDSAHSPGAPGDGEGSRLSVVIVTYDSAAELPRTLPAVLAELREGDELIVCDNGSTDGTPDVVRGLAPGATLVEGENVGFGAGAYHFSGDFDGFAKLALPLRVGAYPVKAFCRDCKWGRVVQLWAKQTLLAGRITGEDFGVPARSFNENWEAVSSFGVLFDVRWIARPRPW